MNQHKGDIVRSRFYNSGMKMKDLAKELGVSRRTLYNWLDTHNLDIHKISRIGKVILYDFSKDFKELATADVTVTVAEEPIPDYGGKPKVSLTIDLDGSDQLLEHWYGVMKKVNASL